MKFSSVESSVLRFSTFADDRVSWFQWEFCFVLFLMCLLRCVILAPGLKLGDEILNRVRKY